MQLGFRLTDNIHQSSNSAVLLSVYRKCSAAYLKTPERLMFRRNILTGSAPSLLFFRNANGCTKYWYWRIQVMIFGLNIHLQSVNKKPGNLEKKADFKNPKCCLTLSFKILTCFPWNFLCMNFNSLCIQRKQLKCAQIHVSALLPGNEVFSDRLARSALLFLSHYKPGE